MYKNAKNVFHKREVYSSYRLYFREDQEYENDIFSVEYYGDITLYETKILDDEYQTQFRMIYFDDIFYKYRDIEVEENGIKKRVTMGKYPYFMTDNTRFEETEKEILWYGAKHKSKYLLMQNDYRLLDDYDLFQLKRFLFFMLKYFIELT